MDDQQRVMDDVWMQIKLLAADPERWRLRRVLEIHCSTCDKPIAQVMNTTPGLAIVYRSFKGTTTRPAPVTGKHYETQAMSKLIVRMLHDGPFICFCGCTRTVLEERDFADPIGKGLRRIVRRRTDT